MPILALLLGCTTEIAGYNWAITVVDAHDGCHLPPMDYQGPLEMDYVVAFEDSAATLYYDGEPFAAGTISGCSIRYESVVWAEEHDGFDVRWRLSGEANWKTGGTGCELPDDVDWEGTETFEIVESNDPELEADCTYGIDVTGIYQGETG